MSTPTGAERANMIRSLAEGQWPDEDIDIPNDAEISEGEGMNGAYVQVWVWVTFDGTELDKRDAD